MIFLNGTGKSKIQVMKGFPFQIEVLRTDRKKTVSIYFEDNLVKVSVPRFLSENLIRDLITKRTSWIESKLKEKSEKYISKPNEYESGEIFSYLGRNYRLKVVTGDRASIKMKNGYLVATTLDTVAEKNQIKPLLEDWYQSHAEIILKEKTKRLARIVGVTPKSVSVRDYKSRWGSCSNRGEINFNWKIILAPHQVVDYVVVHELCHLLEHNHSSRYWKHVEQHVPDWRERRDWLKTHTLII